ncbi:MAG: hypothetical protein JWO47_865 [Candidatus Saccharibacteria bacterium]|nr:hypothetical protein [Candidatus Saccharibacteria bacterium]
MPASPADDASFAVPPVTEAPMSLVSDLPPLPTFDETEKASVEPADLTPTDQVVSPVPQATPEQTATSPQAASEPLAMPLPVEEAQPFQTSETPTPVTPALSYELAAIEPAASDDAAVDAVSAAEAGMPVEDEMELDDEPAEAPEPKQPINIKGLVAVLVVLGAGILLKTNSGTLGTQSTKGVGYTYSFKFYRHSKSVALADKTTALKHEVDSTTASVKLTPTADLTTCTKVGNGWKPVFSVVMNKTSVPVCTPDNQTYMAVFPAPGHEQLFTVSYTTVQKPDTYPVLKDIFSSVTVKK